MTEDEVAKAVLRLAATGIDVDEDQAREVLSVSQEAASSVRYRALTGGIEPTIAFEPRWGR
ncbi:hypothetical protein K1T35_09680 [Pseudonocardia sp. DSM 110487]|uniref:hypothetical protein n=1 Tax=Pseudonocardia sp. DSM 110487 TaxID=2865833 RepID=UPI001C6A30DD|nr:hypothetical protein [Pseudonocardia sp. DSM 110487]QYN37480.1 hypothetical protein K1T35_09680 [Pseudonocardia sp. DSM 110487]